MILQDLGLSRALVQSPRLSASSASATVRLHVLTSLIVYGVVFLMAPLVADFLGAPAATLVFRVGALQLPIVALGAVPLTLIQRELDFRRQGIAQLASIGTVVLISGILLLLGFRMWALILASLAGSAVRTTLYWWLHGWRPVRPTPPLLSRSLFVFGALSTVEVLQGWALNYGDNLIVATMLGLDALGTYALAFAISVGSLSLLMNPLATVSYSHLSRLSGQGTALVGAFVPLLQLAGGLAFPAAVGLALTAEPLSQTVLGGRWPAIAPVIQLLALFPGVAHALVINSELYRAVGRPEVMPRLLGAVLAYSLPAYLLGARFGLLGFCLARASVTIIFFPIHVGMAARLLRVPVAHLWRALRGPALATSGMAVAVSLTLLALPSASGGLAWIRLALALLVGISSYVILLACIDRPLVRSAARLASLRVADPPIAP
jgi:O-antigen/teichoic acid export membrane protein